MNERDMDLGAIFTAIQDAVVKANSADEAWVGIRSAGESGGGTIPESLVEVNPEAEVDHITEQLRDLFAHSPLPPEITFLYFGLFTAAKPVTLEPDAGFYIAGGSGSNPEQDVSSNLTYMPEEGYLESGVLHLIQIEANRGGEDYNFYEYAMMFGAAAMLAKFATRALDLTMPILVGFDSGDIVRIAG